MVAEAAPRRRDPEEGRRVRGMRSEILYDEKINPQERRKKVRELLETGIDVKDISLQLGMKEFYVSKVKRMQASRNVMIQILFSKSLPDSINSRNTSSAALHYLIAG